MIRFGAKARLFEEFLYTLVDAEMQAGTIRSGLWAKAQADAMGDERKTKAIYLKLRVQSLRDEASIIDEFERKSREASRATEQDAPPHTPPPTVENGNEKRSPVKDASTVKRVDWLTHDAAGRTVDRRTGRPIYRDEMTPEELRFVKEHKLVWSTVLVVLVVWTLFWVFFT
jgi:hypothetical protein